VETILKHLQGNKLQIIRPTVGGYQQKSSLSRGNEVVINRLRIGYMRCTHSCLLSGADQPECTTCQCPLTVEHILVGCTDFNDTRTKKYFVTSSLEELFSTVDVRNVLDFIKETHFTAVFAVARCLFVCLFVCLSVCPSVCHVSALYPDG